MIYREAMDDVGRLLTLALRGGRGTHEDAELVALYQQMGDERCAEVSAQNQVSAMVAHALSQVMTPEEVPAHWLELLAQNKARVSKLVDALGGISARVDEAGCTMAAIEGGGILLSSDLPIEAFCPSDIDLLVAPLDWSKVTACFEAEGFVCEERSGRAVTGRREYRRGDLWLGVGTIPFERKWVPLLFNDRTPQWLVRRIPSKKDPRIAVLEPTDALAFVAMHSSLHSFVRAPGIRLHVDTDRVVRDNAVDWDRLVSEIKAMGIETRAFVSLSMAAGLMSTPIPESVLKQLCPGPKQWARIERLLAEESVIANGQAKLGGGKTIRLDALINEQSTWAWARSVALPPSEWMKQNYGTDTDQRLGVWRLHFRRMWKLATRWRPQ
jgi:hypothetical protein